METAVIVTGFLRSWEANKDRILSLFYPEADYYFITWNRDEQDALVDNPIPFKLSKDLYEKTTFPLNLDSGTAKDPFKVNERAKRHGTYWVERLRSQWYLCKQATEIFPLHKYDVIVRLRYDLSFSLREGPLTIEPKPNTLYIPPPTSPHQYNDHMAYGDSGVMRSYLSLWNYIPSLYYDYDVDISYAEHMLKFYIEELCQYRTEIDTKLQYSIKK